MRHATILWPLAAVLLLTACGGSAPGGASVPPPDASLTLPCRKPGEFLGIPDWELMAGGLGRALIDCGEEKAALVGYVEAVVGATANARTAASLRAARTGWLR